MLSRCTVAFLSLCGLAACTETTGSSVDELRKHRDAGVTSVDAPAPVDAAASTGSGIITCYTEGEPSATCALPVHCCFTGYTSQHDGYCTTDACAFGTITCDGPEDCAAGERCCSRAIVDPDNGTVGYTIGCSATACGAPPYDYEVCHPLTGCSSGTCVSAYGNDNDLPRTLYICE